MGWEKWYEDEVGPGPEDGWHGLLHLLLLPVELFVILCFGMIMIIVPLLYFSCRWIVSKVKRTPD